jgi:phosphopantetheinyl transferase (holo-ACP synthase)
VGNDVVDLADAGTPAPRFVARVLAPEERALVDRASDQPALVWRLWAAKEAAFKLWARADRRLVFTHRRFRVDPAAGAVEHDGRTVRVSWHDGPGYVGCCAFAGAAPPRVAVTPIDRATDPSQAVRRLAGRLLARLLGHDDFEILRPAGGPPEVWRRGAPAPGVAVSLSHDGGFVGCAVAVEGA